MTRLLTSCALGLILGAVCLPAMASVQQQRTEDYQETNRIENLDPAERARVEALVVELRSGSDQEMTAEEMDPLPAPLAPQSTTEREEGLAEIRDNPDFKPYLFDLLDTHYRRLQSEGVPSLLRAIASRDDLQPDEVDVISTELQQIMRTPHRDDAFVKNSYLTAGVRVLEKHPSPDHEAIAISVLKRGETAVALDMKVEAAETLSAIGTKRSLQAMRSAVDLAESLMQDDPRLEPLAARISSALGRLGQRVGRDESLRIDQRMTTSARRKFASIPETRIAQPVAPPAGSTGWNVKLAAGLLVVFASLVWLRKRRLSSP